MSPRRRYLLLAALVAVVALRAEVLREWHKPAGDGLQYYQLSQSLVRDGRYALAPPPAPPTYGRMPGYPLLLAYVAVRVPAGLEPHLLRATIANLILDLGTAAMLFLLLRRHSRRAAFIALFLALTYPLLVLLSCYGLAETWTTFLCTAELFAALAVGAGDGRRWWLFAALAGVAAGLAQLTRNDAVTFAPAAAIAVWTTPLPRARKLAALALAGVVALAVFAPWPLRNLKQFHAPHFTGAYWRTIDGTPLPTEMIDWERTWARSGRGESFLDFAIYVRQPIDPKRPNIILPQMFDDADERAEIERLFTRFNQEGWSDAVRANFRSLAERRARAHPIRTWVVLPALRIWRLWAPVPPWELPLVAPILGMPTLRPLFGVVDVALYLVVLAGSVWLWRRRRDPTARLPTRWLAMTWSVVATRTLLFAFAVPVAANQRYVVEVFPLLAGLAALAVDGALAARRARLTPPPA